MIKNLKFGFGRLVLGEFQGRFSYIRDSLPLLLKALIKVVQEYEPQTVSFDEEGSEFLLVLDEWTTYIISCRENYQLYVCEKSIFEIIEEIISDMETETPEEWAISFARDDGQDLTEQKQLEQELKEDLAILKDIIERENT